MRRRLALVLFLLVLIPVALLAILGVRVERAEADGARSRLSELMDLRVRGAEAALETRLGARESEMLAALSALAGRPRAPETLAAAARSARLVRQIFVLDPDGSLSYPPAAASGPQAEFRARTAELFAQGAVGRRPDPESRDQGFGWRSWFWGDGLHWIFWSRQSDGAVVGAEVDRSALLADLLAALPVTESDGQPTDRFALVEAGGRVLYQWGAYSPASGEKPRAARALSAPLEAWSLEAFAPDPAESPAAALVVIASIAAVAAALAGLAVYLHRESSRDLREAAQRMSFVSQVSHELKSPLTNIRLYAELLERRIAGSDARAREQLAVVVSEAKRLGRLIANVLSFTGRAARPLAPRPGVIDEVVHGVLESFAPALAAAGIAVDFAPAAPDAVRFDPDAVEQIVGNLLSNAEKYAARGGAVGIRTSRAGEMTEIEVTDRGPGIPREARERIFRPFVRLSDRLTDGVAGAGIGLAIARELARRHGGDLVAAPSEKGARFVLTLRTPAGGEA